MQFVSQRLSYSKFTPDIFPEYEKLVAQDDVMKHITGTGLSAEDTKERFQVALDADMKAESLGFLAVRDIETDEFIGLAKIVPFENGMIEIGYALHPAFWGKGLASEITERLITYAKELRYIRTLIALVSPENGASVRVLVKQNFAFYREVKTERGIRADYILPI